MNLDHPKPNLPEDTGPEDWPESDRKNIKCPARIAHVASIAAKKRGVNLTDFVSQAILREVDRAPNTYQVEYQYMLSELQHLSAVLESLALSNCELREVVCVLESRSIERLNQYAIELQEELKLVKECGTKLERQVARNRGL